MFKVENMDAELLAKIAENKKRALDRKRLRESPEKNKDDCPVKPTTPALTDAICALAAEFTAFREQVSKKQRLDDDINEVTNGKTMETTPILKTSRKKSSRLDKSKSGEKTTQNSSQKLIQNERDRESRQLSFINSQEIPTSKPKILPERASEDGSEINSQDDFTPSFLENIDTMSSIDGDDLPSNISDSDAEKVSSEKLGSENSQKSKENSFELDENLEIEETLVLEDSFENIELTTTKDILKESDSLGAINDKVEEKIKQEIASSTSSIETSSKISLSPLQRLRIIQNKKLALERRKKSKK